MVTLISDLNDYEINLDGYSFAPGKSDFLLQLDGTVSKGVILSLDKDHIDSIDNISNILGGKCPVRDGKVCLICESINTNNVNCYSVEHGSGVESRVIVGVELDDGKVTLGYYLSVY